MSAHSQLTIAQDGEITTISFVERNILEEYNIQQIGDEITSIIEASPNPKLLIDFSNVEHLSSAALGMLISINNRVRAKGGQLRLANIDEQVMEVFVITKLDKHLQIHKTTDSAMKSFA